MDDQRFDDMIRAITGPIRTRRTLAGGLLAALLPGAAGAKGRKKKGKGKAHGKKPPDRPDHPGDPNPGGDDRDDAACLGGGTRCGEECCGGPVYPDQRCCDGRCLNTAVDRANCGECGETCGADQICAHGDCVCNDYKCPPGQRCVKNNQYYCAGDPDPGCVCGCGGTYTYCKDYFGPGTGACISPGATCQDVTKPNGAAS